MRIPEQSAQPFRSKVLTVERKPRREVASGERGDREMPKSEQVRDQTEALYRQAQASGIEVLLDDCDRKTGPGVKFA